MVAEAIPERSRATLAMTARPVPGTARPMPRPSATSNRPTGIRGSRTASGQRQHVSRSPGSPAPAGVAAVRAAATGRTAWTVRPWRGTAAPGRKPAAAPRHLHLLEEQEEGRTGWRSRKNRGRTRPGCRRRTRPGGTPGAAAVGRSAARRKEASRPTPPGAAPARPWRQPAAPLRGDPGVVNAPSQTTLSSRPGIEGGVLRGARFPSMPQAQGERQQAERQVDQEDALPAGVLHQQAAEQQAEISDSALKEVQPPITWARWPGSWKAW